MAGPCKQRIYGLCPQGWNSAATTTAVEQWSLETYLFGCHSAEDWVCVCGLERMPNQIIGPTPRKSSAVKNRIFLPPLERRFQYQTLVLFFRLRSQLTPDYLTSILPSIPASSAYNFRKSSYPVPFVNTKASLNSFLPRAAIFFGTSCQPK